MATNTTNYGLIKPGYSDAADIEDINDNMEAIDNALDAKDRSLAVVNTGDTAEANITKGELVYVRGHTTLADGLYQASEAITSGASLSGSNLTSTSVSDQMHGTVLYNGSTSTTGNFSDAITNYKFVEIYWKNQYDYLDCTKVYNNYDAFNATFTSHRSNSNLTTVSLCMGRIVASANSFVIDRKVTANLSSSGVSIDTSTSNTVTINLIIGYN